MGGFVLAEKIKNIGWFVRDHGKKSAIMRAVPSAREYFSFSTSSVERPP